MIRSKRLAPAAADAGRVRPRKSSPAPIEIPDVAVAHVQVGLRGVKVTSLDLAPAWSCVSVETSRASRRQRIPTPWASAIRLSLRGPRPASDWYLVLSHDERSNPLVLTEERWVETPPLALECPGGSVEFLGDGEREAVRVDEFSTATGWTTTPISNLRLRGEHEEGITFANGSVEWLLSVTGYDGEGPTRATRGYRRSVTT